MEVGAVKQAFNNEVILLKKKLNQAKIQIIHKLTRKAKQLVEKKAPEPLKEKLKRKAESAVNEVLIIKKIKPKDIAKFIVTHKGELKDFLNKPTVDNDKACARLLLHKALQDKYKFIRGRFSNVPIKDLFMSRLERRKIKKEEKEKKKNKEKGKDNKVVNSEGDWDVEDVAGVKSKPSDENDDDELSEGEGDQSDEDENSGSEDEGNESQDEEIDAQDEDNELQGDDSDPGAANESDDSGDNLDEDKANASESEEEKVPEVKKPSKLNPIPNTKSPIAKPEQKELKPKPVAKKNPEKKLKDSNKTKMFNEKIQQKKFKKDSDTPIANKIVDPFFITATGENYMSVVEPRAPDEIKEEHRQGNRQYRRAVMFGHVPKNKPRRQDNYNNYGDNNRFNNQNGFDRNDSRGKFNNRQDFNDKKSFNDRKPFNNDFNDRKRFNDKSNDEKPEKLHPSWEAKKKKSGILPFEGKKIVFD